MFAFSITIKFAFDNAQIVKSKPSVIIANTIKGKGVSYMENSPTWHGSVKMSNSDLKQALIELGATDNEIGAIVDK